MKALVEAFGAGEEHYLLADYQEAEVRKDFIDKFWIALGWDVLHNEQTYPYRQEVKVENNVKISGANLRADYAFYLAPDYKTPVFFVEAKKPAHNLFNENYYFQTIRYAWHLGHPLAVLTDFEEFHIIDCRYKPDVHTALLRQCKCYHYSQYVDIQKFSEIYWLFSREAVGKHSIDDFAKTLPQPKGRAAQNYDVLKSIDEDFLEEIEEKREVLARAVKKNNDSIDSHKLTEATQRIIDRLVFIRFLEDKLIEPEYYVDYFGDKGSAWVEFIALCRKLDTKYNGVVFKHCFIDEPDFGAPADYYFRKVCQDMCHRNTRFLYNEIPVYILGSIYERFLGKIVRATDKQVKVEAKPDVRKAGGVFYTPRYIVDYIVEQTIGRLVEGKTPEEISTLSFADIACGSGSFLIGVYEYLLHYHTLWYQDHPQAAKAAGCFYNKETGAWALNLRQRKSILLNNVYGVDIDHQAVEVTQISLFLKLLEDATTASADEMRRVFHEKILPDMSENIVCGNSLVGRDILMQNSLSKEAIRQINPMNFDSVFEKIMRQGGFDAIVFNPPYVSTKHGFANNPALNQYLKSKYTTACGQFDAYVLFIERVLQLLCSSGNCGFIVPKPILTNENMTVLRQLILQQGNILSISDFGTPFEQANVESVVLCHTKSIQPNHLVNIDIYKDAQRINNSQIAQKVFHSTPHNSFVLRINTAIEKILQKIENDTIPFKNVMQSLMRGIEAGKNDAAIHRVARGKQCRPLLRGQDVERYAIHYQNFYIDVDVRDVAKFKNAEVYEAPRKLLLRRVGSQLQAAIDDEQYWNLNTIYNVQLKGNDYEYVTGIFNSRLIAFWFKHRFVFEDKIFPYVRVSQLETIPFPKPTKQNYLLISKMVEQMMQDKKCLQEAVSDTEKLRYQQACAANDYEINRIVYALYGLTTEEITIVENNPLK
ncbi:hypothetical protein FACS1894156_2620 [Bacteroidia bacterium]|nr:hypothetical protein FACS1894156_2620 [Bacteroidia bacterium]